MQQSKHPLSSLSSSSYRRSLYLFPSATLSRSLSCLRICRIRLVLLCYILFHILFLSPILWNIYSFVILSLRLMCSILLCSTITQRISISFCLLFLPFAFNSFLQVLQKKYSSLRLLAIIILRIFVLTAVNGIIGGNV